MRYKEEVHDGEHQAIIDAAAWERVQALLRRNGRSGGAAVRNQSGALLKGLIHCGSCGCSMTPAHTTKGDRRYRYYTCTTAQKRGWGACPTKSIPAGDVEQFVVEQIQCIDQDPLLLQETLAPREQARVIGLLVERVEYDGAQGKIAIRFYPTAIKALAGEMARQTKEQTA